jgi:hypothetical protein
MIVLTNKLGFEQSFQVIKSKQKDNYEQVNKKRECQAEVRTCVKLPSQDHG